MSRPSCRAQRQQKRGDVILDRVAHGETQRDTDDARAAKHRAQQRCRPDHVERDHQADDREAEPDRAGDQFRKEAVRRDPVPQPPEPGDQIAEKGDRQPYAEGHPDQREHADQRIPAVGERQYPRATRRERQVPFEPVFDRDDAGDAIDDGFGARNVVRLGHRARQRNHAFIDLDLDRAEGGQLGKDPCDTFGNTPVVARFLRRRDRLDGGRRFGRFGGHLELGRQRHRPQQGRQGKQPDH